MRTTRIAVGWVVLSSAILALVHPLSTSAATRTWITTSGTNDWFVSSNWSDSAVPQAGDDVVITNNNVGVLLTNSPTANGLGSLTISNRATLVFSNWSTTLSATNVWILTNATVTCAGPFTNNMMSNRVWIVCTNLFIAAGGKIDAEGKGYRTGLAAAATGFGPGAGGGYSSGGGGGGHGGFGGGGYKFWTTYGGGITYGSAQEPVSPGSGGGWGNQDGGNGGGAVRIDANGTVTVNGTITADGKKAPWTNGGGGSGGSVNLACRLLAGTNGTISANGGMSGDGGAPNANAGGGRIAVHYDSAAQAGVQPPQIQITVLPGMRASGTPADVGTLWFPDALLMTGNTDPRLSGWLIISNFTAWSLDRLSLSNQWLRLSSGGFSLTVTNDIRIYGALGRLDLGGETFNTNNSEIGSRDYNYAGYSDTTNLLSLTCGGSLWVTNGGSMSVFAARTNAQTQAYGASVRVTGTLGVGPSSTVYSCSHPTNGGSVFWHSGQMKLAATNSLFTADFCGFSGGGSTMHKNGFGIGGGAEKCGGSYGGRGGTNVGSAVWRTYGDSNAPVFPGSGGGWGNSYNSPGAAGGGVVWMTVDDRVTVNGTMSANGGSIRNWQYYPGAGSGGGLFLTCKRFEGGASGLMRANGGNDDSQSAGAAGGGGRIAVVCQSASTSVTFKVQANAGVGDYAAVNGTVVWLPARKAGTIMLIR